MTAKNILHHYSEEDVKKELRRLQVENAYIRHECKVGYDQLQDKLSGVYASLSWRITSPLRRLALMLRRYLGLGIGWANGHHASPGYTKWLDAFDTLTGEDRQAIGQHIEELATRPVISVILPVYNTPEPLLRRAIDSVRAQLYPYWQLCIADDASPEPHVRPLLEEYQAFDKRIRVVFRERNGHISAASNSALELASGEFVAFLDHDDEFAEHALYMVAEEINRFPDVAILYSDEDQMDVAGRRMAPFFKPDWSPDRFYAQNYICHLVVFRRLLVQEAGGFRAGYDGSQDYDLLLRCITRIEAANIRHIPFILYHWRAIAGSTAVSTSQKSYAEHAGLRALTDYFHGLDPAIAVKVGQWPTTYAATWPLPQESPLVSLIITARGSEAILRKCIESIRKKTDYIAFELVIVHDQSADPETLAYLDSLRGDSQVRVLTVDIPSSPAACCNFAVQHARGSVLGFLDSSLEVISRGWLTTMVRHALRVDVGAVGAKLLSPENRILHAGMILGLGGIAGSAYHGLHREEHGSWGGLLVPRNVSAVSGACLVVGRDRYQQMNGVDERNLPNALHDLDFCLRLREAGYRNLWTPFVELCLHGPVSSEDNQQEIEWMVRRWGNAVCCDPYYNPNLTLNSPDFTLAWPPRVTKPWLTAERA